MQDARLLELRAGAIIGLVVSLAGGWVGAAKAGDPPPAWVRDGTHPSYPKRAFIVGVGSSEQSGNDAADRARVEANARAQVAKQLRLAIEEVQVIHNWEVGTSAVTSGGHEVLQTNVERLDLSLEGVEIVEHYSDIERRVLFCLAVMDRAKAKRSLKIKLRESRRRAERLVDEADGALGHGQLLATLKLYLEAHAIMLGMANDGALLRVVSGGRAHAPKVELAELTSKITGMLAGLAIEAVAGNGQKAEKGKPLLEPLVVRLMVGGRQPPLAAGGVPIAFAVQDQGARWDANARTNADGEAKTVLHAIGTDNAPQNKVTAAVSWQPFLETLDDATRSRWSGQFRMLQTSFAYSKTTRGITSTRLAVQILEFVDGTQKGQRDVATAVSQALLDERFDVVDMPGSSRLTARELLGATPAQLRKKVDDQVDVVVLGEVRASLSSKSGQGFVFYRAQASVRAVDVGNGRIMAELTHQEKGAGNSRPKAAAAAMANVAKALARRVAEAVGRGVR